jgi:3-hydroxyacyl-[acyl-carrier-protein] dehydratase
MTTGEIYQIISFQSTDTNIEAIITFNEKHPVFAGHFPGNPIVPGVVQVQIIKEVIEKKTRKCLLLIHGKNIKFLTIISPVRNPKVEVRIEFGINEVSLLPAQATIRAGDSTFMKFSGIYKLSTENK